MQRRYTCLSQQEFTNGSYKLVPIRDEDKYAIMQWRNEQINILRQKEPLTKEKQDEYFTNVVAKLFDQQQPNQLLFSFLKNDVLIGYGGLVHINWESRNAEISFITETKKNSDTKQFIKDWTHYLRIIKKVADLNLDFIKIYTYAYDIRPHLYPILIENDFVEEARLKNHIAINNQLYDVLTHSYFFDSISYRMATMDDAMLYFKWANDRDVRSNSFNSVPVEYESHCKWFFSKLTSKKCHFYLFHDAKNEPIGQVRIENIGHESLISISIDEQFRGKSLSSKMLAKATNAYLNKHSKEKIIAYIKHENASSYKSFISAGFIEQEVMNHDGIKSYKLFKGKHG